MNLPVILINIPTFGRLSPLAISLEALIRVDYPDDSSGVIVVDDGRPQPVGDDLMVSRLSILLLLSRQPMAWVAILSGSGTAGKRA